MAGRLALGNTLTDTATLTAQTPIEIRRLRKPRERPSTVIEVVNA